MKHIVIILVAIYLLCSCGSCRKVQSSRKVMKVESEYNMSDSILIITHDLKTYFENSSEDIEITHEEYDSETGRMKNKTSYRRNVQTDRRGSKEKDSTTVAGSSMKVATEMSDSSSIKKVMEHKETTIPQQVSGLVWALIVLSLALFLWTLVRKNRKR